MASPSQIAKEIEKAVSAFNESIPKVQKDLVAEIELLLKDLDVKNGSIVRNARNLRLIAAIKTRIESVIIKNKNYSSRLKKFLNSFNEITTLQNQYFEKLSEEYKKPKLLDAIRNQAKEATYESLTKAGISANLSEPIRGILNVNITSGAKYTDLVSQVRSFMVNDKTGLGALERYAKQITTDSLNTFARTNLNLVTDDLGLKWFQYAGAIIETSRPFCVAMHEKKYFHKSEIPKLLRGDFEEFRRIDGKLNQKTGLPEGFIPGTTSENFLIYAAGYQCNHQPIPVSEIAVPENLRQAV